MPWWVPKPTWEGLDAYVLGGGDSLKSFPFTVLKNRNVIGCNSAFSLGADIVPVTVFGDVKWWEHYKNLLKNYKGIVATNAIKLRNEPCPWLWVMKRQTKGLGTVDTLAWNGNTGSLALNLALILGAKRVFLLGFDMSLSKAGRSNWHDLRFEPDTNDVYPRFISGFESVIHELPKKFPGREVFNVTDCSRLECFPKISLQEHFGFEKKENVA